MLRQNLSIGRSNVLTMFANFVSISPIGATLTSSIVSNPSCSSLVILNYLIVS